MIRWKLKASNGLQLLLGIGITLLAVAALVYLVVTLDEERTRWLQ